MRMGLKYPQHNRADKGNRQIRSHNTQPTEQWTDEYHWGLSLFQAQATLTTKPANRSLEKKVSLADPLPRICRAARREHG